MLNFLQNDTCVFFVKSVVSLPYLNGTVMTGGSAIINTNSWAVELNGQHELYESDLETKYETIFIDYFWKVGMCVIEQWMIFFS